MKKIIYTRPDGMLCVVHPVINTFPHREQITEDQAVARAMAKLPKDAINPQVVEESSIPSDRTFRNAWRANGSSIEHDMDKCRAIHRERLRQMRKPLMEQADVEFLRALERGENTAPITAKKQALRDVTADPRIDAAKTPDELKSVIPEALR